MSTGRGPFALLGRNFVQVLRRIVSIRQRDTKLFKCGRSRHVTSDISAILLSVAVCHSKDSSLNIPYI